MKNENIDVPRIVFSKLNDSKRFTNDLIDPWSPENNVKEKPNRKIHTFLGVTGCGKTHRLLSIGTKNFLIFFTLNVQTDKNVDYSMIEFIDILKAKIGSNLSENSNLARFYVNILVISRLLYFIYLYEKNSKITPTEFLLMQLNENSSNQSHIFKEVENLSLTMEDCRIILNEIFEWLKYKNINTINFALDDAHLLEYHPFNQQ